MPRSSAPVPAPPSLRGRLDRVGADIVEGWAHDAGNPAQPVPLELLDNGEVIARFRADQYRADLESAGIGTGHCAFFPRINGGWSTWRRHVLRVRREGDHAELPGSPVILEASADGSAALRDLVRATVQSAAEQGTCARSAALRALVTQGGSLLGARAAAGAIGPLGDLAAFHARWSACFPDALAPMPAPARRAPVQPQAARRRALVIAETLADLADARSRACLGSLGRLGHAVEIVTAAGETPRDGDDLRDSLEAQGFACPRPWLGSVEDSLRRQSGLVDVMLFHCAAAALAYGALARRHMPNATLMLFLHATSERDRRPQTAIAAWLADVVLAQSAEQAEALRAAVPGRPIHLLSGGDTAAIDAAMRKALSDRSR